MTLIALDDRAEFTEDEPQRYVLGDLDAPLLVLNAVDDDGVMWVCEEPQGWDAPTVDLPIDRRQDGHGGIPGEPLYEERVLTFQGSAEAPTHAAARAARGRLLRAWSTAVRTGEELLYTHLDDEPAKSLYVLPTGTPRATISDGRWLDYAFVLVAGDPVKRGAEVTYGPARLPSGAAEPGRTYPKSYPRSYAGGGVLSGTFVGNAGDEDADALYRIEGPVPAPIVALSTGEYLRLDLDLGLLDVAEVDTEAGTIHVNGVNRSDAIVPGSAFPLIPSGGVEVRLRSAAGATSATAALYVTTSPRWT